ncbi:DUF2971 domain-containing protein [Alteromonas macleodii]|uniref:DUF2971 domain-containing protein n=1 Tax=Alteromonas macleodii TaxID=28108 RepID=UPI00298179BA|nr:DUF2971 domain-containing protein [Alteromonas macleodii]MDW5287104.1 DUF2971 domain-containing protein [Alteromonas macleodii]|tara:strand:- start:245 stop:1078 length:834 start_codon:yes stop_codon:yes gene_type:complete
MLFKYLPAERIDVLENLKIRFSPLGSLNDPFEAQPLIDLGEEREQQINTISINLEALWERTPDDEKTEENRALLESEKEKLLVDLHEMTSPFNVGQELVSRFSDMLGILSLSRTADNLLMWSHYAQEGKGFVIGFDEKHKFFNQSDQTGLKTNPVPVVYTNKRSHVDPGEKRYYEKLLGEKPRDWAYEEEERIFRFFPDNGNSVGFDDFGLAINLISIPKEAIKSVCIGYKVTSEFQKRILSAISENDIPSEVLTAKVSETEYKVEVSSKFSHNKPL